MPTIMPLPVNHVQLKKYRYDESEKKSLRCLYQIIAKMLENHHDDFSKPLGRLFYIITKTFFTMMKTEKKHHIVFSKTL
jgi:hypothetical protein